VTFAVFLFVSRRFWTFVKVRSRTEWYLGQSALWYLALARRSTGLVLAPAYGFAFNLRLIRGLCFAHYFHLRQLLLSYLWLLFAATILLSLTCGRFFASYPTLACMPVDVIPVKRLHRIGCVVLMFLTFIHLPDNRVGMSVCGKIGNIQRSLLVYTQYGKQNVRGFTVGSLTFVCVQWSRTIEENTLC